MYCLLFLQVGKILFSFKQLFIRFTRKLSNATLTSTSEQYEDNLFTFDVILEIKEEDNKGGSWGSKRSQIGFRSGF